MWQEVKTTQFKAKHLCIHEQNKTKQKSLSPLYDLSRLTIGNYVLPAHVQNDNADVFFYVFILQQTCHCHRQVKIP